MSLAMADFIRELGVNPKALSAFRADPSQVMRLAGLDSEDTAAIASKDAIEINRVAAAALNVEPNVGDDVNILVVVTV